MSTQSPCSLQRIHSISGLKVIAVFGIIVCHLGVLPSWDLCARMVEVLFLLAGFCMAYNHFEDKTPPTLGSGANIIFHKLPKLFPIHLTTFLLQLFFVSTWSQKPLEYIFSIGLFNLSMLHAWFPETQFSFNNVSWFLSALLFCYLLTPTISGTAHSAKSDRRLGQLFWLIVIIRLYIEYLSISQYRIVWINLHANPLVQSLNYSLGFIAGVWFINNSSFNQSLRNLSPAIISWLEFLLISFYLCACYTLKDHAYRLFFILLAIPPIYLLSLQRGIISKTISARPLLWLETINLEIFMFHSFILYHFPTNPEEPLSYVKFFSITFALSLSYHYLYNAIKKYFSTK